MFFSKICLYDQKHTLFSYFARFCTPKRCTRVQCLVLKNNPITWIFGRAWYPPWHLSGPPGLHATPVVRKGHISRKRVNSQDPLKRKFGNFSLYSLNLCQNFSSQAPNLEIFSSQAPKFGNFQFTSPQIWKFSVHKPPLSEASISSQAPHFGNPGRTPLPEKSWVPPGEELHICKMHRDVTTKWVEFTQKISKGWFHFDPLPKRISKQRSNG